MGKEFSSFTHTDKHRNFTLNNDVFLLYVAGYINAIPALRSFMDDLYESNKYTFYEKAKSSPYYDATFMTDRPLEREVSMKRTFGILLQADQDETLQDAICKAIVKHDRSFKVFMKSFTPEQAQITLSAAERSARNFGKTPDEITSIFFLSGYIVYCKHGLAKKDKPAVMSFHSLLLKDIMERESHSQAEFIHSLKKIKADGSVNKSKYCLEYKEAMQTGKDLLALIEAMDSVKNGSTATTTKARKLVNILTKGVEPQEREDAMISSLLVSKVFSLYGCSLSLTTSNIVFDEEELECLSSIVAVCSHIRNHEGTPDLSISDYTLALWLALLSKTIKREREFYFQNNSETQFYALKSMEQEIQQLHEAISDQRNAAVAAMALAAAHNEQIKLLNAELAKENKDAAKPLMAEIAMLRSQMSEMQARLDVEAEKSKELYRLREFVFDMQQGNDIQVEEISLDKQIAGKKIYVFGGHINWRIKLKQKYPKLDVLDGHNTSFDAQKLIDADMVLLNTSNMSHDLYYKVIDVLRKNGVPFDYLGKYSNPNLLEKEISEILSKR